MYIIAAFVFQVIGWLLVGMSKNLKGDTLLGVSIGCFFISLILAILEEFKNSKEGK